MTGNRNKTQEFRDLTRDPSSHPATGADQGRPLRRISSSANLLQRQLEHDTQRREAGYPGPVYMLRQQGEGWVSVRADAQLIENGRRSRLVGWVHGLCKSVCFFTDEDPRSHSFAESN